MAQITIPQRIINDFCIQHRIKRLALFGSVLRDDFRPDSDIDVLVEFAPENRISMLSMVRLERELSELLNGRKVDLRTPSELSRYFRSEVLQSAEVLYDV